MWSLFGYSVIFLIVLFVIYRLWELRFIILGLLVFGTVAFFVTNIVVRNRDMSNENVKKITISAYKKVNTIMDILDKFDKTMSRNPDPEPDPEPEPEPEGFVTEQAEKD